MAEWPFVSQPDYTSPLVKRQAAHGDGATEPVAEIRRWSSPIAGAGKCFLVSPTAAEKRETLLRYPSRAVHFQ
jgi:hypothetical protein